MSSLALRRHGLDVELCWLEGLFTAAELAAADLLLQLSGDDALAASTSTTRSSCSPRSASTCREDLAFEQEAEEERAVKVPAVSLELDRRAWKRYRLLSDLYAATSPATSASASDAAAKKTKRKMHHHHQGFGPSPSWEEPTRYGGDH